MRARKAGAAETGVKVAPRPHGCAAPCGRYLPRAMYGSLPTAPQPNLPKWLEPRIIPGLPATTLARGRDAGGMATTPTLTADAARSGSAPVGAWEPWEQGSERAGVGQGRTAARMEGVLTEAPGDPGELGRRSPLSSYSSGRESMVRHWVSFAPGLSVARAPAAHTDPAAGPPTARLPPAGCTQPHSDSAPNPLEEAEGRGLGHPGLAPRGPLWQGEPALNFGSVRSPTSSVRGRCV